MNLNVIKKIGFVGSKIAIKTGEHAPEILAGVGVISFVGACISAGKGTLYAQEVVLTAEYERDEILKARAYDPEYIEYPKANEQADKFAVYIKEGKGLLKCYAPTFIFAFLSLSSFMGSHYILRKRNVALIAAYGVLNDSFKTYRTNVIEKYGEEEDYRLKNNIVSEKIEIEEEIDGKTKKKKITADLVTKTPTGYSFIFDNDHSMMSITDTIMARDILMMAENSANQILIGRGYITLNEILRSIGLPETTAGQIVGWVRKGEGDGYVDFGMRQVRNASDPDGVAFLLDFNVDGPIYQKIDSFNKRWED